MEGYKRRLIKEYIELDEAIEKYTNVIKDNDDDFYFRAIGSFGDFEDCWTYSSTISTLETLKKHKSELGEKILREDIISELYLSMVPPVKKEKPLGPKPQAEPKKPSEPKASNAGKCESAGKSEMDELADNLRRILDFILDKK